MTAIRNEIQLSVRALVEYVYSAGSIDVGFQTGSVLQDGIKAHQQIQQLYQACDQKEVYLHTVIPYGDYMYRIEGRCDGLLMSELYPVIEEIKSTRGDLQSITEQSYPVHWAQAIMYAYMYMEEHPQEQIIIQLTYVQVYTKEQKCFRRTYTIDELSQQVHDIIRRYAPYAEMLLKHRWSRDASMRELKFPFSTYRKGQRKLAGAVYTAIGESSNLLVKAPTGIGKTMSTIFPTLKAMGEGTVNRVCYLTAKTITRTAAEEALIRLQENHMVIHAVTLTAKDKVCFKEETRCQKEYCEYANGYYDRLPEGLLDLLTNETMMTRQVIERYARKHQLCPFELSIDAAYASDLIIGDYNYVFDPRVSLKRLSEEAKKGSVLLIDEAHNLVDRGRDMYSAVVEKSSFLQLKRDYKGQHRGLYEAAHAVNQYFIELRKRMEDERQLISSELPVDLVQLLDDFIENAEQMLSPGHSSDSQQLLLDTYFAAQTFVRIAKLYNDSYVTYAERSKQDVRLKLYCMDPSDALAQISKTYRAKIYFSATLTPMSYYRELLGAGEDAYTLTLSSPFQADQLDVRLVPLSTRYKDRERTRAALSDLLASLVEEQPGNYLIFFPSYQYLQEVYAVFHEQNPDVNTIIQETGMTEEAREQFLEAFQGGRAETLLGFTVLGGIFSEGIDLTGDRLNRVVVIGVGLPQIGLERDLIKNHYDLQGKNGFDYAYVYPGMNKVLQAGGRLIRTEQDTGLLVLVDDRFLRAPYVNLLPEEWR